MGRSCSRRAGFSRLFLIFVSIAAGWREKHQERYLVIVFLSAGSAVAELASQFPRPCPFPPFFFLAAGICRGRDAAGTSQAGIAVGYAEPVCVNPVLSLPSGPSSPLLPCSKLRCHLYTMAEWLPWGAGASPACKEHLFLSAAPVDTRRR